MRTSDCGLLGASVLVCATAVAQQAVYEPLYSWDFATPLGRSAQPGGTVAARHAATSGTMVLPGLRRHDVEILLYTLGNKVRQDPKQHVLRMSTKPVAGMNVLRGAMAEAVFAENHPDWRPVKSPVASQHDFTRPRPGGGPPENAQVKCHRDLDLNRYIADMADDSRAHQFAVPDDHLEPLRKALCTRYDAAKAAGNAADMKRFARDHGRLTGIGNTSAEIEGRLHGAITDVRKECRAVYMSLGASIALSAAPTVWDWASGQASANVALERLARAGTVLGTGLVAEQILKTIRDGGWRGTWKGNAVIGLAVLVVDTAWMCHQYGLAEAFRRPETYENIGGGLGGLVLGMVAAGATAAAVPGPGWIAGGATIAAGALAGTVGYFGGRAVTRVVLELLSPEMLTEQRRKTMADASSRIEARLRELSTFRSPIPSAN